MIIFHLQTILYYNIYFVTSTPVTITRYNLPIKPWVAREWRMCGWMDLVTGMYVLAL